MARARGCPVIGRGPCYRNNGRWISSIIRGEDVPRYTACRLSRFLEERRRRRGEDCLIVPKDRAPIVFDAHC